MYLSIIIIFIVSWLLRDLIEDKILIFLFKLDFFVHNKMLYQVINERDLLFFILFFSYLYKKNC